MILQIIVWCHMWYHVCNYNIYPSLQWSLILSSGCSTLLNSLTELMSVLNSRFVCHTQKLLRTNICYMTSQRDIMWIITWIITQYDINLYHIWHHTIGYDIIYDIILWCCDTGGNSQLLLLAQSRSNVWYHMLYQIWAPVRPNISYMISYDIISLYGHTPHMISYITYDILTYVTSQTTSHIGIWYDCIMTSHIGSIWYTNMWYHRWHHTWYHVWYGFTSFLACDVVNFAWCHIWHHVNLTHHVTHETVKTISYMMLWPILREKNHDIIIMW